MIDPGVIAAITYSLNDTERVEKYPLTKAVQRVMRKHCNKVTLAIAIPSTVICILFPVAIPVTMIIAVIISSVYDIRYHHEFNSLQRKLGKDEFERQLQIVVDKNTKSTKTTYAIHIKTKG